MGLIARELEAHGIATVCLTSAYSITAAVRPPRALYVDYPLGHTSGKPFDEANQQHIVRSALRLVHTAGRPGVIVDGGYTWSEDTTWKDRAMRPSARREGSQAVEADDERVARYDTPQYQTPEDAALADRQCASCVWLTDGPPA